MIIHVQVYLQYYTNSYKAFVVYYAQVKNFSCIITSTDSLS